MAELPNAVLKRLITKHGGGLRVSASAIERAAEAAEEYISKLAREAERSAEEGKRKTIMDNDIDKARAKLSTPG